MKNFYFLLLFSLCSITCYAQKQEKGQWELGVNIGLNGSGLLYTENNTTTNSRASMNLGASTEYYFSDHWGIKGRIIYDTKGYSGALVSTENFAALSDVATNYLTVPIMANWHFSKRRRWYLHFGTYAGFLIKAEVDRFSLDLSEQMRKIDVGLAYGIGYRIPLNSRTRLYLEYDAQNGFVDPLKNHNGSAIWNIRGALNLGVLVSLK